MLSMLLAFQIPLLAQKASDSLISIKLTQLKFYEETYFQCKGLQKDTLELGIKIKTLKNEIAVLLAEKVDDQHILYLESNKNVLLKMSLDVTTKDLAHQEKLTFRWRKICFIVAPIAVISTTLLVLIAAPR